MNAFLEVLENYLLFASVFALGSFVLGGLIRRGGQRALHLQPQCLARCYTVLLVLPPLAAAWIVGAALLPRSLLDETVFHARHPGPVHRLHLIGDITAPFEPVLASVLVIVAAGTALGRIWSGIRRYRRIAALLECAENRLHDPTFEVTRLRQRLSARPAMQLQIVDSSYPLSFLWGFGHCRLVVSSGLLGTLSGGELAGVIEHEIAHHTRGDNLAKLSLLVCAYASLAAPLSIRMLQWRNQEVELICDEIAAARTGAPLDIADALLTLSREAWAAGRRGVVPVSGFGPDAPGDDGALPRRVRRLAALADRPVTMADLRVPATSIPAGMMSVAVLFITSLMVTVATAPLAVHAAAESLLRLLK
jgi:Zn-dependent protease with chaperone function